MTTCVEITRCGNNLLHSSCRLLWAKRTKPEPIADREHQLNAFGYILTHIKKGASVWRFDRAAMV